jgi:hypothetical protein
LNAPLHDHLVRVVVLRLPRKLRRHAATGRYTCSVGMLRRHAPSACTGRMHSSVSTAGMLRRHAPSACTGRMLRPHAHAPSVCTGRPHAANWACFQSARRIHVRVTGRATPSRLRRAKYRYP